MWIEESKEDIYIQAHAWRDPKRSRAVLRRTRSQRDPGQPRQVSPYYAVPQRGGAIKARSREITGIPEKDAIPRDPGQPSIASPWLKSERALDFECAHGSRLTFEARGNDSGEDSEEHTASEDSEKSCGRCLSKHAAVHTIARSCSSLLAQPALEAEEH